MAMDGGNFIESISQGSDDYYDFPCSPCFKEGRTISGLKHCVDCGVNLCAGCLKDHNKFDVMRGHELLDETQAPRSGRDQLPNQRCEKHDGKIIDVYCSDHDNVGCSTCIAVDHSACKGIKFVPTVAKGISKSGAFTMKLRNLEAEIEVLLSRLVNLKMRRNNNLKSLKEDKVRIKADIEKLRMQINAHLTNMEHKIIHELDTKYKKEQRQNVDVDVNEIDCLMEELKINKLQLRAGGNDSDLFVLLKYGKTNLQKSCASANRIELSTKERKFELRVDRRVKAFIDDIECIGRIAEMPIGISVSLIGKYNIRTNYDKKSCDQVNGICVTSDGAILITDQSNKRLKKLDRNYKVTAHLDLPGSPCGICQIDEDQLAITIMEQKKVQLVSNTEPMELLSSISVGDHCRGIAHHNGKIYICCGGSKITSGEGKGHIEIYSKKGELLRTIYESIETPTRVEVSGDGVIFVYDAYHGLVMIQNNEKLPSRHIFPQLKLSGGMCKLTDDLFCLGGHGSNNIIVVTADGKLHKELLTQKDDIDSPLSLCFDENRSRLLVGLYRKEILKVFHLNM